MEKMLIKTEKKTERKDIEKNMNTEKEKERKIRFISINRKRKSRNKRESLNLKNISILLVLHLMTKMGIKNQNLLSMMTRVITKKQVFYLRLVLLLGAYSLIQILIWIQIIYY
jgi:hypothetical protein